MVRSTDSGAPGWGLPTLILLMLMMQLTVRAEDFKAQRIDILHGETLKAWNELEEESDNRKVENGLG